MLPERLSSGFTFTLTKLYFACSKVTGFTRGLWCEYERLVSMQVLVVLCFHVF